MFKKCIYCNESDSNNFYKKKDAKDGLQPFCISCSKRKFKENKRTKEGLVGRMYSGQKSNYKSKGYIPVSYTKQELYDWIILQSNFNKLYNQWVDSGFKKLLIPSVDRIDDYKGYSLENIQLMTWGDNKRKGEKDRVNGINNKASKSVSQYDINNKKIKSFHSMSEAERITGVSSKRISEACDITKINKTAGGYIWKLENNV